MQTRLCHSWAKNWAQISQSLLQKTIFQNFMLDLPSVPKTIWKNGLIWLSKLFNMIWSFSPILVQFLAQMGKIPSSKNNFSKFYVKFTLHVQNRMEEWHFLAFQASSYGFGHQVQFWTFKAQNIPNSQGKPIFFVVPQTLPTYRYSKMHLVFFVLTF